MIDILIPTVGRADKLAALAANITECTTVAHNIVFIHEPDDTATASTVARMMGEQPTVRRVINDQTARYRERVAWAAAYDRQTGAWVLPETPESVAELLAAAGVVLR